MKLKHLVVALGLLLLGQMAAAEKIVVFDSQKAFTGTDIYKKRVQALNANPEYAELLKQAEDLKSQLQEMDKERQTKGLTWSEEQVADHTKKMSYVNSDFQLAAKKVQSENAAVADALQRELQPKILEALKKVIDAGGYDIVLRKEATLLTVSKTVDITDQVVKELNKQ